MMTNIKTARHYSWGDGCDGLEIAPGVAHQISNRENIPLEIIVTSQPPSHGDRVDLA
jgi:hypothetical protein